MIEESDGCTGVPFFHDLWGGSYQCCLIHDQGGSDWELFNCWTQSPVGVPLILAALAITIMIVLRPFYHWWQDLTKPKESDMKRIILHWTAGGWEPSAYDLKAYHFVIGYADGKAYVETGVPVDRNKAPLGAGYAAHTLNCNTDSIGVSLGCMRGATESPYNAGDRPMTEEQFSAMIVLVRELANKYGIPITPKTILSHAEVQGNLGITQRAKWDYTRLPFKPELKGARAIGDYIRSLILEESVDMPEEELPPVPAGAQGVSTADELNVRSSPNGEIRGKIPRGTPLVVVDQDGDWLEVQTPDGVKRNYTVWVYRPYVDILDGPPAEEPTTPHPKRLQAAQLRAIADQLEKEAEAEMAEE